MTEVDRPALATTVHDRTGAAIPGLRRSADVLRDSFGSVAVLATDVTSPELVSVLEDELSARVIRAPADGSVGRHRRSAVQTALDGMPSTILYSDLDHILRWIDAEPGGVGELVAEAHPDLMVIGRTPRAMAACPARLRETEAIVNRIYALVTGRSWDLMFAVRLMSPAAARVVIREGVEDSYANDVEWPMIVEQAGLSIGYREADGLSYRIAEDFDSASDIHDADPLRWIDRVHIADLHAQAIKRRLEASPPRVRR